MKNKNYIIPAEIRERTLTIKKSRFIACAKLITSRDEAKVFLNLKQIEYPDARHHCWAYLIGNPASASHAAMNDDGEPSGTAGKPILNVIQHKGIGDVMVLVTRYFGGIKLGAGGLTRAYSGATELVLSELKCEKQVAMKNVFFKCDFSQEQSVRHWASLHEANVEIVEYSSCVKIKITLPVFQFEYFQRYALANHFFDCTDE